MNFSEKDLEVLKYLERDFKKSHGADSRRFKIIHFSRQIVMTLAIIIIGSLGAVVALILFPNGAISAIIYGFMVGYLIYAIPRIHARLVVSGFKFPFAVKINNANGEAEARGHKPTLVLPKGWLVISGITIFLLMSGIISIGVFLFVFLMLGIITIVRSSMSSGF